jgi:hypothetical protein
LKKTWADARFHFSMNGLLGPIHRMIANSLPSRLTTRDLKSSDTLVALIGGEHLPARRLHPTSPRFVLGRGDLIENVRRIDGEQRDRAHRRSCIGRRKGPVFLPWACSR